MQRAQSTILSTILVILITVGMSLTLYTWYSSSTAHLQSVSNSTVAVTPPQILSIRSTSGSSETNVYIVAYNPGSVAIPLSGATAVLHTTTATYVSRKVYGPSSIPPSSSVTLVATFDAIIPSGMYTLDLVVSNVRATAVVSLITKTTQNMYIAWAKHLAGTSVVELNACSNTQTSTTVLVSGQSGTNSFQGTKVITFYSPGCVLAYVPVLPPASADYNVTVSIDPANIIPETNEQDNNFVFSSYFYYWLPGYSYLYVYNVTNPAGADLNDYDVLVHVDTNALIYAGSLLPNCGDIRFVDLNGNALSYFIEPTMCGTTDTWIWVKIPDLPPTGTQVLMFFGNSSAQSESNGYSTFLFFDDFEENILQYWVKNGLGDVVQDCTVSIDGSCAAHKVLNNDPNGRYRVLDRNYVSGIALEAWIQRDPGYVGGAWDRIGILNFDGNGYGFGFDNYYNTVGVDQRATYTSTASSPIATVSTADIRTGNWYFARIAIAPDNNVIACAYYNDTLMGCAYKVDLNTKQFDRVYIWGGYDYWVDDMRLRYFVQPEPTAELNNSLVYGAADLTSNISLSPTAVPYTAPDVNIEVNVCNNGYLSVGSSYVAIYADNNLLAVLPTPPLAPGECNALYTDVNLYSFIPALTVTLTAVADYNNQVLDVNRLNNSSSAQETILYPDLTASVYLSPSSAPYYSEMNVDVNVCNVGYTSAPETNMALLLNGGVQDVNVVPALAPGQCATFYYHNISLQPYAPGSDVNVVAIADVNDSVPEESETNNTGYALETLLYPNLYFSSVVPSSVDINVGQSVYVDGNLCNNGSASALSFYVELFADGNEINVYGPLTLPVGGCTTLRGYYTPPSIGIARFLYVADFNNAIYETTIADDNASTVVYVTSPLYLVGWDYRRMIEVNASALDYNVTIEIVLDTNALISAGKMNADCNDIRFTPADTNTVTLPYWIEDNTCGTSDTHIFVRLPDVNIGSQYYYMYYGNLSAPPESNGDRTFLFFDDFDGNALDTNKWPYIVWYTAGEWNTEANAYYEVNAGYLHMHHISNDVDNDCDVTGTDVDGWLWHSRVLPLYNRYRVLVSLKFTNVDWYRGHNVLGGVLFEDNVPDANTFWGYAPLYDFGDYSAYLFYWADFSGYWAPSRIKDEPEYTSGEELYDMFVYPASGINETISGTYSYSGTLSGTLVPGFRVVLTSYAGACWGSIAYDIYYDWVAVGNPGPVTGVYLGSELPV